MIINMEAEIKYSGITAHKVDWQDMADLIKEAIGADEVEIIDADVYLEECEEEFDEEETY